MSPADFDLQTLDVDGHLLVVTGELDVTTVPRLRRSLDAALAEGRPRLVIDLSGATYLDSSGLAELLSAHQRAADLRGALVVVVSSSTVRRTLEVRGVAGILTIVDSREAARAALA